MSLAWIAIAALVVAVALSFTTAINVGIVAMAMAWIIGVTLLFSIAQSNGTLSRITGRAVGVCRGRVGLLPFMFFGLGLVIATIGPGGTPASALLAPPAMAVAGRAGISPFLMAIMVGNGTLAGTLSPFAPTGIVANGVMASIGLGGVEWHTYAYNAVAHALVAFGGFALFGGLRLFGRKAHVDAVASDAGSMEAPHWFTLAGIGVFILAVAGLDMHVGMTGFLISAILILLGTVDQREAIQRVPWGVILMVTGVSVLVSILEATQGMDLITDGMARVASPVTLAPIVAFGAGVISVYSSTSGVVLPAFLPMVPGLSAGVGAVDPLPIAWSMNVGASLVDLSSLSTVGALFLAAAPEGTDTRSLFNKLLAWGLAMSVVAAVMCVLWF
jgi:di/tricarboxylate transporter